MLILVEHTINDTTLPPKDYKNQTRSAVICHAFPYSKNMQRLRKNTFSIVLKIDVVQWVYKKFETVRDTEREQERESGKKDSTAAGVSLHSCHTHLEFVDKAGELLMPVVECWGWGDDQEGSPDVFPLSDRAHEHKISQTGADSGGRRGRRWWERKREERGVKTGNNWRTR